MYHMLQKEKREQLMIASASLSPTQNTHCFLEQEAIHAA